MTIFHLAWRSDWERLTVDGEYRAESIATEGFIHATREPERVPEVANLFYNQQVEDELLLITLDESKLTSTIRYEDPGVGHLFPHIYGPVQLVAVTSIQSMGRDDGQWHWPNTG